jgi:hypothetical protein
MAIFLNDRLGAASPERYHGEERKREGKMAKQEFLANFRIARNLFVHNRVNSDSLEPDQQASQNFVGRAAIWLTPKSVKGFNVADFPELSPDRQNELQTTVRDFLEVANKVPPSQPATPGQLSNAKAAFAKMLAILQPYVPPPPEGEKVEAALKKLDFPRWVVNWDYEFGDDEYGSPAVWVNFFADEATAPNRDYGRFASEMTRKLLEELPAAGCNSWPFVRLRTGAEHKKA